MNSTWFFWQAVGFIGGVVYCSFFEWTLHRFVMHKNLKFFQYPFRSHALIHHTVFKADQTYHFKRHQDKKIVKMAWWNAPLMWTIHLPWFYLLQKGTGVHVMWGLLLSMVIYYIVYEYMHYCMHVPKDRNVEFSPIFYKLNGHHLLHHRYMHRNFNVVLPLADMILGTLILRSPIKFAQAVGPSLPCVQPKR
ncbi:MAG: fatty acid hydroxylase [Verrucomicrobiota bacterium]|nr:fatty acid hydroxylase [Verrucomicrobiota bacterium]